MPPFTRQMLAGFLITLVWLSVGLAQTEPAPSDSSATEAGQFELVGRFVTDLFDISAADAGQKASRIVVVILIVLIARFFVSLVKGASRLIVYSSWGPFKYIFQNHQRAITVHGLLLSLVKYVVYLSALGYILQELGVNYTTFLASLSLVGIAVGFGSQGLVQDVVTGFFILFENQFSRGDMVEISAQVGIVEDIGLRTTRIRNYFGAEVTLQNRNIPFAARYRNGAFEAFLDVAIAPDADIERAGVLLDTAGREFYKQFEEIIMEQPEVRGLVELDTGERFLRLYIRLWPAQQWVVDTQLIPRIRELFAREAIPIPADRVVAFYHTPARESISITSIGDLIRRAGRRATRD